ncbi:MAG: nitrogen fixation protein NifQ [Acidiphilium sp.]|nr:nitrogen fixation protein NifQ [Acidiphilium sp.]MDD4935138.1 nitrogen fixation protein NifQ [Acidiphilium sp.]
MNANEAYQWLITASGNSECDPFDIHVLASILAIAVAEARGDERALCDGVGLSGALLNDLITKAFPGALAMFVDLSDDITIEVDAEEQSLRDVLLMYGSGTTSLALHLSAMIARRCRFPHHLWQDLGLQDRAELSHLMNRHFETLARRNDNNMKWKKFLYRLVCRSEGFSLCVAPVCSDCDDFSACFGAEDGEARLARVRNGMEIVAA